MTEQNSMKYMLRVKLSEHEQMKLETYATKHGWTVSHVIREYIRRLPNPTDMKVGKAKTTSKNARRKQLDLLLNAHPIISIG